MLLRQDLLGCFVLHKFSQYDEALYLRCPPPSDGSMLLAETIHDGRRRDRFFVSTILSLVDVWFKIYVFCELKKKDLIILLLLEGNNSFNVHRLLRYQRAPFSLLRLCCGLCLLLGDTFWHLSC